MNHKALIMAACVPARSYLFNMMRGRQHWGVERIRRYQDRKLRRMIRYSWNYVPFYRKRWSGHISDPGDIRTIEDL